MYIDSAYLHNETQDFTDNNRPLVVGSCGTYRIISPVLFPTFRPQGRLDYQLLYVAGGKALFTFQGMDEIIPAGNMVLYRPHEEQNYCYSGEDHTEVFWLHFTGGEVDNLLRKYGIADHMQVIHTGTSLEYKHLFLQMIQELKLRRADYEELLSNYMQQLLIMIHRAIMNKPLGRNQIMMNEMDNAVRYFHENYNQLISIEDYAASLHMSVSWFIRNFKEYTNETPAQYLVSLRVSNAKTLLESSDYNITEIASIVGYDNPLYFSRIFKKQYGMSPAHFRKQLFDKN